MRASPFVGRLEFGRDWGIESGTEEAQIRGLGIGQLLSLWDLVAAAGTVAAPSADELTELGFLVDSL